MRPREWIYFSYVNLRISSSPMFSNDLINHFFSFLISFRRSFYENIPKIAIGYLFFCYLDFGSTFHLKLSYRISAFTYNKTYTVIGNWNNICIWWRRTIWCHHAVIHLSTWLNLVVNLCSNNQLLLSNFVSCSFISWNHSFNSIDSSSYTLRWITND
jgi:hypothetical protein